ncbi:MAG: O-antigen export system, permease protein [Cytophagales bacterium]|jgi:lipopolysaccharide transport system permease protein|nr:ABC transporter permease [Bacteroidota bacterium]MBS1980072.1 ABC transporter permease [Bacteroidota bacterium]WHZ07178.1 MAG: O-antigen export system, permease protein [Cytophagales bacterium]
MSQLREEEFIIEPTGNLFNFKEIWHYRELFYFFTWRDIKIKYKQTMLGFLWAILQPLLMMTIFTLFFGRALNIPSQNLPYPVYVFSGLLIWNIFSTGLSNAANSMVNNASIIKKIYFPRLIVPVSSILVALFDFLMALILFMSILIFYQQPVSWTIIFYWPFAMLLSVIATLGLGSWLAALNVKYRDFRYVIPFLIQVLFFLTPVIYPITLLKYPMLQYALATSPMYVAVEFFRLPLTGSLPNLDLVWISLGSNIVFLLIGLIYFRKTEDFFADIA